VEVAAAPAAAAAPAVSAGAGHRRARHVAHAAWALGARLDGELERRVVDGLAGPLRARVARASRVNGQDGAAAGRVREWGMRGRGCMQGTRRAARCERRRRAPHTIRCAAGLACMLNSAWGGRLSPRGLGKHQPGQAAPRALITRCGRTGSIQRGCSGPRRPCCRCRPRLRAPA
jgi:hypothetical protein